MLTRTQPIGRAPVGGQWGHAWRLVSQGCVVSGPYQPRQAALVRTRVRALAPVIAALVVAWIPLDVIGLDGGELARILPMRIALAAALLQLARMAPRLSSRQVMGYFTGLQAVAFGAMQLCLEPAQGNVLRVGYGLFPFVLVAQLAVFPLPWGCTLRLALVSLALLLAPLLLAPLLLAPLLHAGVASGGLWNDLWLLGVIASLAAWAGQVQLGLLIDLLGARSDAAHDLLTGLDNRRSAERRLDANRMQAMRHGEPLSVLMIDLDHFKRVNDRWGHACGDRVLVATAQVLREELRGADLGARHGGEEFLAILPSTGVAQAMDVAERIRERIARVAVPLPDDTIRITASLGVATLEAGESAARLVSRADDALYRAKAQGRNRCLAAVPTSSAPLRSQFAGS